MIRVVVLLAALLLAPFAAQAQPLKVVATFTVLADMIRQVGGEDVTVATIVGPDGDVHTFEPTPATVNQVAEADLLVANGLGLEPWLERLVHSSGYRGPVVLASAGISPVMADGVADPHAWQDLELGRRYVATITEALAKAAPGKTPAFRARAETYSRDLDRLSAWVKGEIGRVPPGKRKIITSHDAFGYFGRAYGIQLLSPQGISTEAEPTAGDLARLARQMAAEGVKAVFLENMTDPRLIQALAHDTGAVVGGTLYADSLSGPGGPAPTYQAMFRHNVAVLVPAMLQNEDRP